MAKGRNPGIKIPGSDEASVAVRTALQQIVTKLGMLSDPEFGSMTLAGLTITGLSGVLKATAGVVSGSAVHADLGSVTANQHHNQAHVLDGADHTVSGLTAGHVLQALTPTTFGFAAVPGTGTYLLLDQTTPQHVINGAPEFDAGIEIKAGQKLYFDGV